MADLEKKTVDSAEKTSEPKKKKASFFSKLGKFFKECKSELKKIVWYSRKQTFTSTILVLVAIVVSSVLIGLFDYAFSSLLSWLAKLV